MRARAVASPEFVANFAASVPTLARAAIQAGLDEWSARVDTDVPVVVDVNWEPLPRFVAAASEPLAFVEDPATGFETPIALANARAGVDLDRSRGDMYITFSSREHWNVDTNSPAAPGAVDLMSITLHEVGHGIGFYSASQHNGYGVEFGTENSPGPTLLDSLLMTSTGILLVDVPGAATNRNVVWAGAARDAAGHAPRIASGAFQPHTSLMHLDEYAYPRGDPDSLMTSMIRRGETVHSIGPAVLGMLHDMGWQTRSDPPTAPVVTAPPVTRPPTTLSPTTTVATTPTTSTTAVPYRSTPLVLTPTAASKPGSATPGILAAGLVIAGVVGHTAKRVRAQSMLSFDGLRQAIGHRRRR